MRFPNPAREAVFLSRPNRYRTRCRLGARTVACFCPNPGRLMEMLTPGARALILPAPPRAANAPPRVTRFDHFALEHAGEWVSVDTRLANRVVRDALAERALPELGAFAAARAEVTHGDSRFDFELTRKGRRPMLVEVKSVTLAEGEVALFPDAPTTRGTRHVDGLADAVEAGTHDAAVLFIVQRESPRVVRPHTANDPAFAAALARAKDVGVRLLARNARVSPEGVFLKDRVRVEL